MQLWIETWCKSFWCESFELNLLNRIKSKNCFQIFSISNFCQNNKEVKLQSRFTQSLGPKLHPTLGNQLRRCNNWYLSFVNFGFIFMILTQSNDTITITIVSLTCLLTYQWQGHDQKRLNHQPLNNSIFSFGIAIGIH